MAITSKSFAPRFKNAQRLTRPVGWSLPVGSIQRPVLGDGFMLLGDAAGLIDPFTGEGIGNAMISAKHAVKTASLALEAKDFSQEFLKSYERELFAQISKTLKLNTKLHYLSSFPVLLDFTIKRAGRNQEIASLLSKMSTHKLPMSKITSWFFIRKLLFS